MAVSIAIDIQQNSRSISNNTTNVTVKVNAKWTNGSYNALEKSGTCTIDGTKYTFTSPFNTGKTSSGSCNLYTKTLDILHSSDGTKTLKVSASYTSGVSSGTVTASASKALATIPRKSTLSVANGTLNTAQTLTVTRQSGSFTHTITYRCGSASGTICTKSTSTSMSFTPPLSLASQNTTGTSVSVKYTITTYNGDTNVGSNSYTKTCSIPSSVKPSVTISVSDPKGYASTYDGYLQTLSKLKITLTASTSYGAAIKSYKTTADGKTYTTSSITTAVISAGSNITISATVTDARGRSGTASKTITVIPYTKPNLSSVSVYRSNSAGTASSSGEYLTVRFNSSVTSISKKNTATYTLQYKKNSASSYTTVALTKFANNYAVSKGTYTFAADTDSSYNVVLKVADKFTSDTGSVTGASIKKLWSILKGGSGFAFGKVAELSGYLDVGFKTAFRDHVRFENSKCICAVAPNGTVQEAINPCNSNGNLVLGYSAYEGKDGNTNIYGHDVYIGVSNISDPRIYRFYKRQGDSIELTFRGAGYVTNSGKDVSFWIPFAVPIVGSPTVTVSSGNGFVIRQGSKYTHGSAADTFVSPTTYEATATAYNGVYIKAAFSNVTNVTNNDTTGIYWNGTITFS